MMMTLGPVAAWDKDDLLLCVQLSSQHSDFLSNSLLHPTIQIEIATVLIQEVTSWNVQIAYAFWILDSSYINVPASL